MRNWGFLQPLDMEQSIMNERKGGPGASRDAMESLNELNAKRLLSDYRIPVVTEYPAADLSEAISAAEKIGYPVVVKGLGARLLHKTELGIVHVGIDHREGVAEAVRSIQESAKDALEGVLVQKMVSGARELAAGLFHDPDFGPVVMFGVGGVMAEALSDVTFRLAPLTRGDAQSMIQDLRAERILGAFRGEAAVNQDTLIDVLTGLSDLAMDRPDIAEIDINPLIVQPDGNPCAVDALIVLGQRPERADRQSVSPGRLHHFFHPRSIAFVGASSGFGKWGYILPILTIAGGFGGRIWMVNPRGGEILGMPVHARVTDIPEPVDLAVVTVPAHHVPSLIPELAQKGIRNMLLITSGFSETGLEGREREAQVVALAREAGILVLGPNTMGINNPHIRLYTTGSRVWPQPGDTSVVCQSGNMGVQLLVFAEAQGIGIRCFSGSGNEAMIGIEDYLEGFEADNLTRNIMLYVESLKDGRRFFDTARRVCRKKPVVMMKGGRTESGNQAAASHTGALATNMRVFRAMCRQAGSVMVDYPMELLDCAAAFSSLPMPRGGRMAIMTLGGGWGVVTADLCNEFGLDIPPLSAGLTRKLDDILPPYWSRANPVDIVGEQGTEIAYAVLESLMNWDTCDGVIILGILGRKALVQPMVDIARESDPAASPGLLDWLSGEIDAFDGKYMAHMAELMQTHQKPIIAVNFMPDKVGEKAVTPISGKPYAVVRYSTPERAVKAISKMVEYRRFLDGVSDHPNPRS